jgi:ParB/RepB/Spo0J family partition protein
MDPNEILADDAWNVRQFLDDDEELEALCRMAIEFDTIGQLQPGLAVRDKATNRAKLVAGFRRLRAAKMLRDGFTFDGVTYQNDKFAYRVTITDGSPEELLVKNLRENVSRRELSPIEQAVAHQRLREQCAYTETAIAEAFNCGTATVARHRDLLTLDETARRLVHNGRLSVDTAILLIGADEETRTRLLANVKGGMKLTSVDVKHHIREAIAAKADEPSDTLLEALQKQGKPKSLKRSLREARTKLENFDAESGEFRAFTYKFTLWLDGAITDDELAKAHTNLDNIAVIGTEAAEDFDTLQRDLTIVKDALFQSREEVVALNAAAKQ